MATLKQAFYAIEELARRLLRDACGAPSIGVDPGLGLSILDLYPLRAGSSASSQLEATTIAPAPPGTLLYDASEDRGLLTLIWAPQPGLQVGPIGRARSPDGRNSFWAAACNSHCCAAHVSVCCGWN
jgi:hypothetical protein